MAHPPGEPGTDGVGGPEGRRDGTEVGGGLPPAGGWPAGGMAAGGAAGFAAGAVPGAAPGVNGAGPAPAGG